MTDPISGYLTSINFRHLNTALFQTGLLFYSRLYTPVSLQHLKWTEMDRWLLEHRGGEWPQEMCRPLPFDEVDYSDLMTLKRYLGNDPSIYGLLRNRVLDSWCIDEETDEFFSHAFQLMVPEDQAKGSPIMELEVYKQMWRIWSWRQGAPLKPWDELDLSLIHQDLFVADYLARRHRAVPILSRSELMIREDLLRSCNIVLWKDYPNATLKRYFPQRTLHEMLRSSGCTNGLAGSQLREILVPDIAEIPIAEVARFVERDRAQPVITYVAHMMEKYGKGIGTDAIAQEVAAELFRLVRVLAPGVKDVAIGVLGNVPSPLLINPVGLLGVAETAKTVTKMQRQYPWILTIRELSAKKRDLPNA